MLQGYGIHKSDDEFFEGHPQVRGPLQGMESAAPETAVPGGYGTTSPTIGHIQQESVNRWDWINAQSAEAGRRIEERLF